MYDYIDIHTSEGLFESELYERFNDMLDECYGNVSIAGLTYSTSQALREVDPIAYRVGFGDWIDGEIGETIVEMPNIDIEACIRAGLLSPAARDMSFDMVLFQYVESNALSVVDALRELSACAS